MKGEVRLGKYRVGHEERRLRYILLGFVVLGLVLGPFAGLEAVGAPAHHRHSMTVGLAGPFDADHRDHGHAVAHCGPASCAPSFAGIVDFSGLGMRGMSSTIHFASDDRQMASLCLDSDPPVPKPGIPSV